MMAVIGLAIFAMVLFSIYNAIRFLWTRNNLYGRRMVYSVIATLVMVALIVLF